ncbi:MAG: GIY-YIG nuclease family protein [bacterium]|nr:GIY-YIG nuclease family protein [bacterium]
MFYNYVLQSKKNNELYIGYTTDLKRRLAEHNRGLNPSTKRYIPWQIIYYEACLNDADAKRREGYMKTTQGGRLLKRRLKEFLYESRSKDLTNLNFTTG